MDRKDVEALVEKAQSDPAFRRSLLADPTGTVARELNVDFPAGVKVRVFEETERELYLVLPLPPADTPLDDSQLDRFRHRDERRPWTLAEVIACNGTQHRLTSPVVSGPLMFEVLALNH